jgi:hypothetical protein
MVPIKLPRINIHIKTACKYLARDYLDSSDGQSAADKEIRHLATVALSAFKEHVAMSKRIYGELTA